MACQKELPTDLTSSSLSPFSALFTDEETEARRRKPAFWPQHFGSQVLGSKLIWMATHKSMLRGPPWALRKGRYRHRKQPGKTWFGFPTAQAQGHPAGGWFPEGLQNKPPLGLEDGWPRGGGAGGGSVEVPPPDLGLCPEAPGSCVQPGKGAASGSSPGDSHALLRVCTDCGRGDWKQISPTQPPAPSVLTVHWSLLLISASVRNVQ